MGDRKKVLSKHNREPLSPISASNISRTPKVKKTTIKTSSKSYKTPSKDGSSANENSYDRFIPNRALMDTDVTHHLVMKQQNKSEEVDCDKKEFSEKMEQNLYDDDMSQMMSKILQLKEAPPQSKVGEVAHKVLYTKNRPTPAKFKSSRYVPSVPDKILDAPEIVDDYYLNLLDWGNNGIIALPLYNAIYLWNSNSGEVRELFGENVTLAEGLVITCVKWIVEGVHLAVGLSNGSVELWDASTCQRVRTMSGHVSRVGSLDWNEFILTSGSKSGAIHNHDVRVAEHHTSSYLSHVQEVCGLSWSCDGKLLASGANDNTLNIWDASAMSSSTTNTTPNEISTPLHSLHEHLAAVKALSWCPWQHNVLASGAGTADRNIRIWNTSTGVCLKSIDTMAQVSGILWSGTYKEIVASHGNMLSIWKYPQMIKEAELTGHNARVLNITMSPNGHIVASVGADETLRFWKCFEPDQKKVKPKKVETQPRMTSFR